MASPRPLPLVTPETAPYWTGGASNELRLPRCVACNLLQHPSMSTCPTCGTDQLEHTVIDGAGVVLGFSVNHQQWLPNLAPPYVVVVVALDAEPSSVRADSSGRFHFDSVAPGIHRITLRRVGYASRSVDSIVVTATTGARVRVPLRALMYDGDGCGYLAIRTRKPWWKWW